MISKVKNNSTDFTISEINHDIWRKSIWCYVKIQSLVESFINRYLSLTNINISGLSLKEKLDIASGMANCNGFDNLYKLNHIANNVKHNNGEGILFDSNFLKDFCINFNNIVLMLMPNSSEYYLDQSFFNPPVSISRSLSNHIETKIDNFEVETTDCLVINCGVGKRDNGFVINIKNKSSDLSEFEKSVYAVIYNFMQRSANAKKNCFVLEIEKSKGLTLDYSRIFRYQMCLLASIKCGYSLKNKLSISASIGEREMIGIAFKNITHYANMICELCNKTFTPIELTFDNDSTTLSIDETAEICIKNASTMGKGRSFWFALDLIYQIETSHQEEILKEFLQDFFGYEDFRQGQLEAIKSILNNKKRSICVMPTGSGKSLVYYMNALLSPSPTIVISPTLILAKDQKRNLKELHNIDDCTIYSENKNEGLKLNHKLIYMTPEDFQSYNLVLSLIHYNTNYMIANIVLDEVHTLCNWSHDFRPEYLMLCNNLFSFVDNCKYVGFTATANHKVLSDLIHQLKIEVDDIIQPVKLNMQNFSFEFISCSNEKQQLIELLRIIEMFLSSRGNDSDKMIVFTHNLNDSKSLSKSLAELDNYETSCFDSEHTYSYMDFVSGVKHVLIADSEMGIGINLPGVVCTVHFGLPNSKAQYVQEIGRANRNLGMGKSVVIFIDNKNLEKSELKLISFETSIDEIVSIISHNKSNLSSMFSTIIGSNESYNASSSGIYEVYESLSSVDNFAVVDASKQNNGKLRMQKYLYKLHILGVVDNWYFKFEDDSTMSIQIEMDFDKNNLNSIKEKTKTYLNMMGDFSKYTFEICNATNVKDLIYTFEKWYYDEFLRYYREQLLNVIDFFNYYSKMDDNVSILKELSNYFDITFQSVNSEKDYISGISIEQLLSNISITNKLGAAAEELLSTSYDVKLDLICFLYNFQKDPSKTLSRLLRIIDNLSNIDRRNFFENLYKFYNYFDVEQRLLLISKFSCYYDTDEIISTLYKRVPCDEVFYGYISKVANKVWREL